MAITKPAHKSRRARTKRSVAVVAVLALAVGLVPGVGASAIADPGQVASTGDVDPKTDQKPEPTEPSASPSPDAPDSSPTVPADEEETAKPSPEEPTVGTDEGPVLEKGKGSMFDRLAALTVPGQPGTPQAAEVVYAEDFEAGQPSGPRLLDAYTGAAPLSMTYTADPAWLRSCNGYVLGYTDATAPSGWACTAGHWSSMRTISAALGQFAGSGGVDGTGNHIVAAYTGGNPLAGANKVQFETARSIPVTPNRFYTFSVDAGNVNCQYAGPKYAFYLLNGNTEVAATTGSIDPCTSYDKTISGVRLKRVFANSAVLFSGSEFGVRMRNGNGGSTGNDGGFDNVRVLDATPQLDKSFGPARQVVGRPTTLTFTVTNTTDLAAKKGWSFTDTLSDGLAVADAPNVGGTCANRTVDAAAGASEIKVKGDLTAGQSSCTVTVEVTGESVGTFENCADNVDDLVGINPPGCAEVTFERIDRGDAPASYSGASSDDGPAHRVNLDAATGDAELTLGDEIDYELQAAPNAAATGDDEAGTDDEDGVTSTLVATTGSKFDATVKATNTTGEAATLAGWLDLDGDGAFEQSERVVVPVPAGSSGTSFTLHLGAPTMTGATYARFRLFGGDVSDPSPIGTASAGEVEDYRVQVEEVLPTVTCTSDARMFNTAYNDAGGKLSPGSRDLHWEVGAGNANGPSSVTSYIPAYVVTPHPAWYPGAFGSAAWIGNTPSAAHTGNVDLYFRYRFKIEPSVTLDNFVLPMSFFADNSVPNVWVNGVSQDPFQDSLPQSATNPYFHAGFQSRRTLRRLS